jgi:spermidine synthase
MWKTKFGRCIDTSSSGYKVYQNHYYRWLTLGSDAIHTLINRRAPYRAELHYLRPITLMARLNPGATCILGLGGAGIPHLLQHTHPNTSLTAIELSPEIIQIANQFFMIQQLPYLKVLEHNAVDYIKACQETYDHLIIDIYGAYDFPSECCNSAFFMQCKYLLTEKGFLAVNVANPEELKPILQYIKEHFYLNTIVIPIKKCANTVILASKSDDKDFFDIQIRQNSEIKKIAWVSGWGHVGEYL